MGTDVDAIPLSGIIRIRDMMYSVTDPYRLDQGDVSFDAPESVKAGIADALARNRTHYLQTDGLPRLRALLAEKLRRKNAIPVEDEDVLVTNGGIHALYLVCQALLEPGDEVVVPDPEWPPCMGSIVAARATPVGCPLREAIGWRYDLDELRAMLTPRTRAIYVNSPHNPTGGVLTRADLEAIASLARERDLWLISDEAYEDILYDGGTHVSPASFPDGYERTVSFFTFSKTFAITGLRLGYVCVRDARLRERMSKLLFYTTSNVASLVQFGGVGGLEGPASVVEQFRAELEARRNLFYDRIESFGAEWLSGKRPAGAFYAFLRIGPALAELARRSAPQAPPEGRPVTTGAGESSSLSWLVASHLIDRGRIGCVPGADFGPGGEGYLRLCFARDRGELGGALDAMGGLFAGG